MNLGDKKSALPAVTLATLTAPNAAAQAEDVSAESRWLKQQAEPIEPLKARLRRLEAEVVTQRRERKEARGNARNTESQPPSRLQERPLPPAARFRELQERAQSRVVRSGFHDAGQSQPVSP